MVACLNKAHQLSEHSGWCRWWWWFVVVVVVVVVVEAGKQAQGGAWVTVALFIYWFDLKVE